MIALDTNVLVRFLTQDDVEQGKAASDLVTSLTEENPGFVCREVLVELVWVLERSYHFDRGTISAAIQWLLSASELNIEASSSVSQILHLYTREKFGFSDLMIRQAASNSGCKCLFTFDQKAARLDGVKMIENST